MNKKEIIKQINELRYYENKRNFNDYCKIENKLIVQLQLKYKDLNKNN